MTMTQCKLHNKYNGKDKPGHKCLACNIGYLTSYPTLDPGTDYSLEELKELKEDIAVMTNIGRSALVFINREIKIRTNPNKSPVCQDADYGDPYDDILNEWDEGDGFDDNSYDPL